MKATNSRQVQGLHYLFEDERRGPSERLVSFCSDCQCILKVSKELRAPDRLIETLDNRCPGCGCALETSIATRSMPVAPELSAISLSEAMERTSRTKKQFFQSANSLRRFRFGYPPIDNLLEPMDPGWLVVLRGPTAGVLAELLCLRAQLPHGKGGLDSASVFIDGGNCSDPYLFSSLAKRARLNPKVALRRVTTSRAFTIYQLANLVSRQLPKELEDNGSRLAVVSDVFSMFADPSIDENERRRMADAVVDGVRKTKAETGALLVVTLVTKTEFDSKVTNRADLLLELRPDASGVRAELVRHPLRRPGSTMFNPRDIGSTISSAHQSMVSVFGMGTAAIQTQSRLAGQCA